MTTRAHLQPEPMMRGAALTVVREDGPSRTVLLWQPPKFAVVAPERVDFGVRGDFEDGFPELRLPDDDLRAIYEALGEYFGHAGHDVRALRRDYDAERGRVDRLIAHLIEGPRA